MPTSRVVRNAVSGVGSSWKTSATSRRCLRVEASSRSSMSFIGVSQVPDLVGRARLGDPVAEVRGGDLGNSASNPFRSTRRSDRPTISQTARAPRVSTTGTASSRQPHGELGVELVERHGGGDDNDGHLLPDDGALRCGELQLCGKPRGMNSNRISDVPACAPMGMAYAGSADVAPIRCAPVQSLQRRSHIWIPP